MTDHPGKEWLEYDEAAALPTVQRLVAIITLQQLRQAESLPVVRATVCSNSVVHHGYPVFASVEVHHRPFIALHYRLRWLHITTPWEEVP